MDTMFAPEALFDLTGFGHRAIFADCAEVWEVLRKIGAYVRQNLRPDVLGRVEKGGFVAPDVYIGAGTVVEPFACVRGPRSSGRTARSVRGPTSAATSSSATAASWATRRS
jgi:hypothetical protein